ncbi:MAG: phosphosulfolactate synthase [Dehalococcoidales bacterium]
MTKAWEGYVPIPVKERTTKPRTSGYTMVIEKGLGLNATRDLMNTAADYIDAVKNTFGTAAFLDEKLIKEKIEIIKGAGVDVYPGGTFLEAAVAQGVYDKYLERCKQLGFTAIEVSDGTIEIPKELRKEIIIKALDKGFKVISEVGKKDPKDDPPLPVKLDLIRFDLSLGAFKVIVEAREASKGVGIYDATGAVKESEVDDIVAGVDDVNDLIWEAALKNQQLFLIRKFGPNVNIGNVPPEDILALEALRCGLRGDTLKAAVAKL